MADQYSQKAEFLTIYIAEAHASNDWNMPDLNTALGVSVLKPKVIQERVDLAQRFIQESHYKLPMYVDSIDNVTMEAYGARPERLYLIVDGKIAYKGGPGPYCFSYDNLEKALQKALNQH